MPASASLIARVRATLTTAGFPIVDPAGTIPPNGPFVVVENAEGEVDEGGRPLYAVLVAVYADATTRNGAQDALEDALRAVVAALNARKDMVRVAWTGAEADVVNEASPAREWLTSDVSVYSWA